MSNLDKPQKKIKKFFKKGQQEILYLTKALLYRGYPELFEKLDFQNDSIFLDPLLIGFFTLGHTKMTIEQILFGYFDNEVKPKKINIYVDVGGVIYLPNYGYLLTEQDEGNIILEWNKKTGISLSSPSGESVEYNFEELLFLIEAPSIEICKYSNPIYTDILLDWQDKEIVKTERTKKIPNYSKTYLNSYPYLENMKVDALKVIENVEIAFSLIKEYSPQDFKIFMNVTRRIVCFHNPLMQGFATKNVHGTAFLSISEKSDELFFLDELVHQCSHNAFNAITSKNETFFKVHKDTPLRELFIEDVNPSERRSFYDTYHGLYTVSNGTRILNKIFNEYSFENKKKFHLYGRLAIKQKRFRTGIQYIDLDKVFTPKGRFIYNFLDQICLETFQTHPNLFTTQNNFDNQPAVFSIEIFKNKNKGLFNKMMK